MMVVKMVAGSLASCFFSESISLKYSQLVCAGDIEPEEGPRATGEEEQGVEGEDQGQAGGDPWTR